MPRTGNGELPTYIHKLRGVLNAVEPHLMYPNLYTVISTNFCCKTNFVV